MLLLSLLTGAHAAPPLHLANGRRPGGATTDVHIREGRFVDGASSEGVSPIDLAGAFVVPGLVDSHVHLTFWPVAEQLLDAGVVAAVDLAAPETALASPAPLQLLASGPMLTATGGYPTTSWGRDGYGLEVGDADAAKAAVDRLHRAGARIAKIPLDRGPSLDAPTLQAAVEQAHAHGMKVVAHAMNDDTALRAAAAGVDVLAHTPVGPMSDEAVAAWAQPHRAVISTLTAFGASDDAVDNLRRLHQAHARILYGTDLGNRRVAGVDAEELRLLRQVGLSPAEILASCTTLPAEVWGLEGIGSFTPGAPAHLLVLPSDPLEDPTVLARPRAVYVHGQRRGPKPLGPRDTSKD